MLESKQREIDLSLHEIESELEKKVIADIKKRQQAISGLQQDSLGYTAVWGKGGLAPGCRHCLQGKWTQVRTTTKCNLDCSFCCYYGIKDIPEEERIPLKMYLVGSNNRLFTEADIRLLIEVQGKKFLKGVAWVHFEPLAAIDKMLSPMKFIHKKGYHQWLYTNGILASKENLKKLADSGLEEIRFNLAATNCSDQVIRNMRTARKYFKYLCVESPMFTAYYDNFMKKKKMILDTGVDHIHFAELQLFSKTKDNFKREGITYRYKKGYVSPIKSRQLIYNIFETASREKWDNVVLHDCSNSTKFYRGLNNSSIAAFGQVDYRRFLSLDKEFYKNALRYLKDMDIDKRKKYEKMLSKINNNFIDPVLFDFSTKSIKHD
jgi:uncharacterized protein